MQHLPPKVRIAIETIARMRVLGIRDNVIAAKLGYTQSGLSRIVALPEYQDFEQAVLQGAVSKMDEALAGRVKEMKELYKQAVPSALSTLFETCRQRRDLRAAMSAASEILDRDPDGTFSKKSIRLVDNDNAPSVSAEHLAHLTSDADAAANAATLKKKETVN
jgi:hypothetical protein